MVLAASAVRQGYLFLAIFLPGVVTNILKHVLSRARPRFAGDDPFAFKFLDGLRHVFDGNPQFASMPSGHATTAFAVAVAFGTLWPRLRPLLWTYAALIALSRVVIAAHHPSDVLAGAIVGCVGALLVRDWYAARGLGFVVHADGSVAAKPGPSFERIKRVARSLTGQ
jgi:undecaprenyl-diphosphatase